MGRHASSSDPAEDDLDGGTTEDGGLPAPTAVPRGGLVAQWPLALVFAVCTVGVLTVVADHFRRGTVLFAGGIVLAAGLRAVLPKDEAGLLVVRSRVLDVITLSVLGFGVLAVALIVPKPN